jgi:hypothetical protein
VNDTAPLPPRFGATLQAVGQMDFKGDVRAAFCKQTGKLCDEK